MGALWLSGSTINMSTLGRRIRSWVWCYFMILSLSFNPQGHAQLFQNHKWPIHGETYQKFPRPQVPLQTQEKLRGRKPWQVRSRWRLPLRSQSLLLPTLLLAGSHQKYWVGQKVHLGFSVTSFLNPNEFFGQPNREIMNTGVRQTSASNFHLWATVLHYHIGITT